MEKQVFISLFLDKRRELRNGKYPVKLRVFTPYPRKQKLYPTKFEFSEKDFFSIWETKKPRLTVMRQRAELQSVLNKAEEVANEMSTFTIEGFEKRLYQKKGQDENVLFQYDEAIKRLKNNKQVGTASTYYLSKKAIINYLLKRDLNNNENNADIDEPQTLLFREITSTWLNNFENYLSNYGRSQTTVSMYVRTLRTLFNQAISNNIIKRDLYPFGRGKYQVPAQKAVKKALTKEQLKKLYEAKPKTDEQQIAKDYFFFLFNCSGLNVKDMASLKYETLHGDKLIYTREKTKRTSKANLKPVVVYLNDYSKNFIERYGNKEKKKSNLIFNIFTEDMSEEERFRKSHNFTRFLNQHLKLLAKANDLPEDISTYWSRHSFATNAIRSGASLEQISQALNHHDLSTTKGYFAGFEDDAMRALTDNLMNFD